MPVVSYTYWLLFNHLMFCAHSRFGWFCFINFQECWKWEALSGIWLTGTDVFSGGTVKSQSLTKKLISYSKKSTPVDGHEWTILAGDIGIQSENEERMKPSGWFSWLALSSVWCFETFVWVTEGHLVCKTTCSRFSSEMCPTCSKLGKKAS